MGTAPSSSPTPTCPRCDYDQSGLIATWRNQCPLESLCTECGLRFQWRDVLTALGKVCPGFIENEKRLSRMPAASLKTLLWSLSPWVFWKKIHLSHANSIRRYTLWALAVLLTAQATIAIPNLIHWSGTERKRAVALSKAMQSDPRSTDLEALTVVPLSVVDALTTPWYQWQQRRGWGPATRAVRNIRFHNHASTPLASMALGCVAFPLFLAILVPTRRVTKLHSSHIWRATRYSVVGPVLLLFVFTAVTYDRSVFGYSAPAVPLQDAATQALRSVVDYREAQTLARCTPGIGMFLWSLLWWRVAIGRGFLWPKPWLHWGVLAVASTIAFVVFLRVFDLYADL